MATEKEVIAKSPSGRAKRTPVGVRNILTVANKDPNFEYRIVNDTGDRIAAFEDAGWELVEANAVRVGDKRVERTTPEGTKAQVSVGKGEKAFVMRIPKEFYKEDQEAKLQRVRQLEESIKPSGDFTGKVTITQGS